VLRRRREIKRLRIKKRRKAKKSKKKFTQQMSQVWLAGRKGSNKIVGFSTTPVINYVNFFQLVVVNLSMSADIVETN